MRDQIAGSTASSYRRITLVIEFSIESLFLECQDWIKLGSVSLKTVLTSFPVSPRFWPASSKAEKYDQEYSWKYAATIAAPSNSVAPVSV
jgi:hypothetical protein